MSKTTLQSSQLQAIDAAISALSRLRRNGFSFPDVELTLGADKTVVGTLAPIRVDGDNLQLVLSDSAQGS